MTQTASHVEGKNVAQSEEGKRELIARRGGADLGGRGFF
jgi:hypothetical protein